MDWTVAHSTSVSFPLWVRVRFLPWICGIVFLIVTSGCAHYPINQPLRQSDPQGGYRAKNFKHVGTDDDTVGHAHLLRRRDTGRCFFLRRA